MQARCDIGIIQRGSFVDAIRGERGIRSDTRTRVQCRTSGGGTIKELSLVDDSDGGAGSVGDLLYSLGYQLGGSSQIQLQGLNKFLRFYNRGKIFREVTAVKKSRLEFTILYTLPWTPDA